MAAKVAQAAPKTPFLALLEWFGEMGLFCAQLFRAIVTPPYEGRELLRQMDEIRLDLALREPIRRPPVELGQTDDGSGVRLSRALGQTPHHHVVVHSISKLAHDALGEPQNVRQRDTRNCVSPRA